MKEQFVPYEIAIKLKEKGFNQSCMAYVYTGNTGTNVDQYVYGAISHDGNPRCENYNAYDMSYSLPLWQQVIDWFWDKHNIFIRFEVASEYQIYWEVEQYSPQKIDNPKGAEINKLTAKQKAIEHALTLI